MNPPTPGHRLLLLTLLLVAALHPVWLIVDWGDSHSALWFAELHYLLAVGLSLALSVAAWHRSLPQARPALGALVWALALYGTGEVVWVYMELVIRQPPAVSVADALYIAQYVPLIAALLRFSRFTLRPLETARLLLDSAIVTTVLGIFAWKWLLADIALDPALSLAERATGLAYPLMDLAVLGVLLLVTLRGHLLRFQEGTFAAGLLLMVVADIFYITAQAGGGYLSGSFVDTLWVWSFVLLALGGWLGSRHTPAQAVPLDPHSPVGRLITYLPYGAITCTGGFLLALSSSITSVEQGILGGILGIIVLVTVRQGVALADNQKLNRDLEQTSSQLRAAQTLLSHRAEHDPLTGLHNRRALQDHLHLALEEARQTGLPVGVLFVDLDRMKQVNDSYGHPAGDHVLQEMSRRFLGLLRGGETVARVGGDEFVLLLPGLHEPHGAAQVAERVISAAAQPVELNGQLFYLTASVGVAVGPRDSGTADGLVQAADIAMYQAKQSGKNQWSFFDDHNKQTTLHHVQLEAHFREALEHGGLDLHYQPLQKLRGSHVVGFEALLRWTSPLYGAVSPAEIIPLVEDRGLSGPLGTWVLHRAAAQVRRWRTEIQPDLYVSVNISAAHFFQADFTEQIRGVLQAHNLPGSALLLELTEGTLLRNMADSVAKLVALAQLQVAVALDDFGTGYSSLSYLRQLPVTMVKIDRSFVQALRQGESPNGDAFIRAITMLAHSLDLTVVAEGLEEEWQRQRVASLGSDVGQGYVVGRPMPGSEIMDWYAQAALRSREPLPAEPPPGAALKL